MGMECVSNSCSILLKNALGFLEMTQAADFSKITAVSIFYLTANAFDLEKNLVP